MFNGVHTPLMKNICGAPFFTPEGRKKASKLPLVENDHLFVV